jgi:acyl transferase domain-containing protein
LVVLTADSAWDVAETASWARVLVEVTSLAEAEMAAGRGAHGIIARGTESGGRVSELSTFALLRQLLGDDGPRLPVWAAGGIGPHTAVGSILGGTAGVVLDSQLGLMPESDLPGDVMSLLRRADGTQSVLADAGQDSCLARMFEARWHDTATAVRSIRNAIADSAAAGGWQPGQASQLLAGDSAFDSHDAPIATFLQTTARELDAAMMAQTRDALDSRAIELSAIFAPSPGAAPACPRPADIAVVGMAGIFAGSHGIEAFWRTILSGKDMVTEVPPDRWDPEVYYAPSHDEAAPGRYTVSKWGGFLEPVLIDPLRYGIPPSALGSIDPSQLLALEVASEAMLDAGCPHDGPQPDHSRTGVVFAAEPGSADDAGLTLRGLLPAYMGEVPRELDTQLPTFTEDAFPGHLANVIAGRIANRLNLGGPNFTVDAACAASLAAVDEACKHLADGTADLMLCGAVDLHNSIGDYLMFGSVNALSPSGRVATFDSSADGTTLGEGVACVVLKRLADAERDGDRVYAVIKGVGAASDGRARSLTAPLVDGQIRAMRQAYHNAGVSPSDVGLIEAHGTGTVVGDQTELDSLTTILTEAGAEPGSCVLGSVKSQIGHTKCAAGLAGLIKSALAVYHGVQPPTINLTSPNQAWDPERSPFAFLTMPRPWLAPPSQRTAGVSAFGFGGTNYHVVLSGHHATAEPRHGARDWPAELFCFRGSTRADMHRAVQELADVLRDRQETSLRQLAARTAHGAEASGGTIMAAVVARDIDELQGQLKRVLDGEHNPVVGVIQPSGQLAETGSVAFLFPGQGSQRTGSLAELFLAFPELREYLSEPWAGLLFPPTAFDPLQKQAQADRLRDTRVAQPVLGICGLAVNHLLERLGIHADMSGGHSYGELVALSAAGAFDAATLLELSRSRADAILSAAGEDPGTMAAVGGTRDEIAAALAGHEVTLANLNAPTQVVISGTTPAVEAAVAAAEEKGLSARRLQVACAFHSPVVAGANDLFARTLADKKVYTPRLPVWSNRTAEPYPTEPDLIREEMATQISSAVRFSDQVAAMYAAGARVFIEAGPGRVLTGLVDATLDERPHLAVACDGPAGQRLRAFLITLAQLACAGVPVDLSWLFHSRIEPAPPTDTRPRWSVNGHLIRDPAGGYLPGATVPARMIKEFPVSPPAAGGPRTPEEMLAEYLRTSREMIAAHRDVMMSFFSGQPAGRLVLQTEAIAPVGHVNGTGSAGTDSIGTDSIGTGSAGTVASDETVSNTATSGTAILDVLLGLISERTGYPVDLIEPDLDLEADLSIDSIKRTAIASEMATRLGLRSAAGGSVLNELVRARTVRAMTEWLERKAAELSSPEAAPAKAASSAKPETTGPASEPETVGSPAQRLVPKLVVAASRPAPASTLSGARFVISGGSPAAARLAQQLRDHGAQADVTALDSPPPADTNGLILLDGLGESDGPLPPVLYPLIRQHLIDADSSAGPRWVLAAGSRDNPDAAGLSGLFRTIAIEYPQCLVRYAEFGDGDPDTIADHLLNELLDTAPEPAVRHSDGARHRLRLSEENLPDHGAPDDMRAAAASALGLTSESVVVMIGGARGITAWFASELAAAAGCRIELIGRTPLPAEPVSEDIADAADAAAIRAVLARQGMRSPAKIGRATREILARREISSTMSELRKLGATARYHCADVQDEEAIRRILKIVYTENGRIDGLVYAAGIIDDHLIRDKEPRSFARVFGTKVNGAKIVLSALDELGCPTGFAVLYGSISATFGSRGQADYAAANDALETVGASWAARTGRRCLTVHWGPWAPSGAHTGMVNPDLASEFDQRGIELIGPRHGAQSLLRELAWGNPALTSVVYSAPLNNVG